MRGVRTGPAAFERRGVRRMKTAKTTSAALLALALAAGAQAGLRGVKTVNIAGDEYVALSEVASFYGMRTPPSFGKNIPLRSPWSELDFEENSRRMSFNGMQLWLHMPTTRVRHRWSIAAKDMAFVIDPLLRPGVYLKGRRCKVVVLDPGHGGQDRGASGWRAVEEKRVNLDVAKRARVLLANEGMTVYLTRDGDRYVNLDERCRMAARWGADVFVSIHMNSSRSASASGVETYVLASPGYPPTNASRIERVPSTPAPGNRHEEANAVLGCYLHKGLLDCLKQPDRGLRRARFVVLKEAPCPAALVECGFVSNRREAELMLQTSHRESIARGISDGVLNYLNAIRRADAASVE